MISKAGSTVVDTTVTEMAELRWELATVETSLPHLAPCLREHLGDSKELNLLLLAGIESALSLVSASDDAAAGRRSVRTLVSLVEAARSVRASVDREVETRVGVWEKALGLEARRGIRKWVKMTFGIKASGARALFGLGVFHASGRESGIKVRECARRCRLALSVREMLDAGLRAAKALLEGSAIAPGWRRIAVRALDSGIVLGALRDLRRKVGDMIARTLRTRRRGWVRVATRSESIARKLARTGRRLLAIFAHVGGLACRVVGSAIPVLHAYVRPPASAFTCRLQAAHTRS